MYPALVRELSMEKLHVGVKGLVERASSDSPHLYAMRSSVLDDWKSRLALLPRPVRSYDIGVLKQAVSLLGGVAEGDKVGLLFSTLELTGRVNDALTGGGFSPLSQIAPGAAVFPSKYSAPNFWKANVADSTFYHFTDYIIASLPPPIRLLITDIARARDIAANGVFICDKIKRIPFYGKIAHPISKKSFVTVNSFRPTDLGFHAPSVRLLSREVSSHLLNPSIPLFCRVEFIFMPARISHGDEVVFIVTLFQRLNENGLSMDIVQAPQFQFNAFHSPSPEMSILRIDSSLRPAASIVLSQGYIPGVSETLFILDYSLGYPARQA